MTRRTFIVFAIGTASAQMRGPRVVRKKAVPEKPKPGVEKVKQVDPGTEAELYRVTDPNLAASFLPPGHQTIFARHGHFLVYARFQGPQAQAWSLDLKSWRNRQLTHASALDPDSLTLTEDEKSLVYRDGNALFAGPPGRGAKKLHEFSGQPGPGLGATAHEVLAAEGGRLLSIPISGGQPTVSAESQTPVEYPCAQPGGSLVSYLSGGGIWVVNRAGGPAKRLSAPADGRVTQARWTAGGASLLFLSQPTAPGAPITLCEVNPNEVTHSILAKTSRYGAFTATADASVFFGVSSSNAAPIVFLLLRQNRRELALCEHAMKNPAAARVAVSPDSQHLFFHSDREGKSALYMLDLEKLVEKPES